MLQEFVLYLRLGFHHIADLAGYDHILFITALAIPYAVRDWRRLLVLVTAFTVGHSATLALATLRLVAVSSSLVEALIPATIFVTAVMAWREIRSAAASRVVDPLRAVAPTRAVPATRYVMAALFGLIHGLGFSSYLRALLGQEESIAFPLLAFNVGLELGQLLILSVVLAIGSLVVPVLLDRRRWMQWLVGVTATLALWLLAQRF